jgi:hypothetical protein
MQHEKWPMYAAVNVESAGDACMACWSRNPSRSGGPSGWSRDLLGGRAQAFSSTPMAACTTGSGRTTSTTVEVRLWRCGMEGRGGEGMFAGVRDTGLARWGRSRVGYLVSGIYCCGKYGV